MFHTLIEHGSYQRTLRHWDRQAGDWSETRQAKQPLAKGDRVIVLVNNLGSTPLSELYGVWHRLSACCADFGLTIERKLIGSYCTSLDMQGISITMLKVDDELLSLWDAPVNTPAFSH
ncbi:dihydroxyacetone kinase subunit DhaK [Yersinia enterocolitica]|nr:dihydroxyacetone kinase subunit DhaK [Yersinia enterocolitica]